MLGFWVSGGTGNRRPCSWGIQARDDYIGVRQGIDHFIGDVPVGQTYFKRHDTKQAAEGEYARILPIVNGHFAGFSLSPSFFGDGKPSSGIFVLSMPVREVWRFAI